MEIIESEEKEVQAQVASSNGCTGNSFKLEDRPWPPQLTPCPSPRWKMFLVASLAVVLQFGWAIQLSLLRPYIQLLSLSRATAMIIWTSGPISGLILQPVIGFYSDHSTSSFGRRRPFIIAGVALENFAEFLIGFAADFGIFSYNTKDPNNLSAVPNFGYFMVGFIILDAGNNILQLTCRALIGDMAADDHANAHLVNAAFSFFMAAGNITGYLIGTYNQLYLVFPFSRTTTCDINCANLKSSMIISITLLLALTSLVLSFIDEKTFLPSMLLQGGSEVTRMRPPFFGALKTLLTSHPMRTLLLVTCLNWVALFPFLLYDTDWMGREIYGGVEGQSRYDEGVRAGVLGLTLNSMVIGVTSLVIEPLKKRVGGAKRLWGITNLLLAICMATAVYVSKMAWYERHGLVGVFGMSMPFGVAKSCALSLFSLLGISIAVTYNIPYALASIFSVSSSAGQGIIYSLCSFSSSEPI